MLINAFKTNNILIASYIYYMYPETYLDVEKSGQNRYQINFLFNPIDEITDVTGLFYTGSCRVEPQSFYNSIKFIKSEMNRVK